MWRKVQFHSILSSLLCYIPTPGLTHKSVRQVNFRGTPSPQYRAHWTLINQTHTRAGPNRFTSLSLSLVCFSLGVSRCSLSLSLSLTHPHTDTYACTHTPIQRHTPSAISAEWFPTSKVSDSTVIGFMLFISSGQSFPFYVKHSVERQIKMYIDSSNLCENVSTLYLNQGERSKAVVTLRLNLSHACHKEQRKKAVLPSEPFNKSISKMANCDESKA